MPPPEIPTQPPDNSLESLVAKVRRGDLDAFGEVVKLFEQPIRAFIYGRCPPWGEAEEVAHHVFIAAWRQIHRYQPGTDFRAWLFTLARYHLLAECTRLRREGDRRERATPDLLLLELERRAEEESPRQEAQLEALDHCLGQLDGSARQLLSLRYHEGRTLEAIAGEVNRSVGALKKAFFHLRRKLHECVSTRLQPKPGL